MLSSLTLILSFAAFAGKSDLLATVEICNRNVQHASEHERFAREQLQEASEQLDKAREQRDKAHERAQQAHDPSLTSVQLELAGKRVQNALLRWQLAGEQLESASKQLQVARQLREIILASEVGANAVAGVRVCHTRLVLCGFGMSCLLVRVCVCVCGIELTPFCSWQGITLGEVLGEGSYGKVYAAVLEQTGAFVAVKVRVNVSLSQRTAFADSLFLSIISGPYSG